MAIFIRREGQVEGVPWGSLSQGDLVGQDGTIIDAAAEKPMGIIADEEPTENAPEMVNAYGEGTLFEDDALDTSSISVDDIIWSDGDGTYSSTDPAPASGSHAWAVGVVREVGTAGTDTGAVIEFSPQLIEGA